MNVISPGVYRKITDLTAYVDAVPSTIGMIAFLSEKGPDNVLREITSQKQLLTEYGKPNINKYGQGLYNADMFLRNSQSLYVIRVTSPNASYANLYITLDPNNHQFTTMSYQNVNSVDEIETHLGDQTNLAFISFYGIGRGTYYNKIGVSLKPTSSLIGIDAYVVDIYVEDDNGDMVFTESFVVSLAPNTKLNGKSLYIEDVINTFSNYVNCRVNESNMAEYLKFLALAKQGQPDQYSGPIQFDYNMGPPVTYTKIEDAIPSTFSMLLNGDDDSLYNADGTVNWSVAEQYLAQAYLGIPPYDATVINNELTYFSVVYDADYPDGVKDSIKALCETRGDCVAILDNGFHGGPNGVQNAINDASGVHDYNSWYVALYEGHQKIYDIYTGREIWVSPSYFMAYVIPHNDSVAESWFAPAGYRRAALSGIRESALIPNKNERDRYYEVQLNPIAKLKPGYVVWGQQTKYPINSPLRDLNLVRLLLYIDVAISQFALYYIFEQNDRFTWNDFRDKVSAFLQDIVERRGLKYYKVEVGATEYELQTNAFHADIYLIGTTTVEKIFLNYTITKS